MSNKLAEYRRAADTLPTHHRLWPLYGQGFDNLGHNGAMIDLPLPAVGADQLLVRHDAVGICFSDIKVIRAGEGHPRIYRSIRDEPVVLGHEVSMTVVAVGEALRDRVQVGDRFIVQADIYIDGVSYAYGYEIQGGYSQYNIIDQRVLNGDHGNYLLPVQSTTGYAEAALNEPWACVEASYTVEYRTAWQTGGAVWLTGDGASVRLGAATDWRPQRLVLDVADDEFATRVRNWTVSAGVEIVVDDGEMAFDDIVVLGGDADLVERAFTRLAKGGLFNVVSERSRAQPVNLDIGRMHYDHITIVGTETRDISAAYRPIRTELKVEGDTWILGAAGPMGHMHLQRALEIESRPARVVASNVHRPRMEATAQKFAGAARSAGVELHCLSEETYGSESALLAELERLTAGRGFDDIVVMAPSTAAIEHAMPYLADNGVMNVFAGLPRGTQARFNLEPIVRRGVRFTGTSGSSIDDLRHMLDLTESRRLSTNSAVAAVAGLEGVADGLHAVAEGRFAGKVVIYPNIQPLPLMPLGELEERFPTVFAKLRDGQVWTNEAEIEFLELML